MAMRSCARGGASAAASIGKALLLGDHAAKLNMASRQSSALSAKW